MHTLSPSKSIKGSNYGEFLKDKNVLLCTRLYKYAPNLESLLTQQYVCVMCTLWSDNTMRFYSFSYRRKRKYAAYLELCAQLIYLSYRWVGVLYIYMCWADLPDLQLEYYIFICVEQIYLTYSWSIIYLYNDVELSNTPKDSIIDGGIIFKHIFCMVKVYYFTSNCT
jgi:hypothetical protein